MIKELNHILSYIEENISLELSLRDISDEFYYSESYISRNFNKYVGRSFKDYLNKRRLSRLAIDLKRTEKSIEYLAHNYGYSSQKYLSNLFKREFGVTPNQYRKGSMFIQILPMREIKGDNSMKLNNINDICMEISHKADNQDNLLDIISNLDNVELFEQNDSMLRLVSYIDNEKTYDVYEIELSVLAGNYSKKTIFEIDKSKHEIVDFYRDKELMFVLKQIDTGKEITASVYDGVLAEVIMHTAMEYPFNDITKTQSSEDLWKLEEEIQVLKDHVSSCTNSNEIIELVNDEDNCILLKHFGSEFVIVKQINFNGFITLFSVYLNMVDKKVWSHSFFNEYIGSSKTSIKKDGITCHQYVDGKLRSKSFIYSGEELTSSICLKFPSGISGNGGWDFSSEFDNID